jgi:hypothetical protein
MLIDRPTDPESPARWDLHSAILERMHNLGCTYVEAALSLEPMHVPAGYGMSEELLDLHQRSIALALSGVPYTAAVDLLSRTAPPATVARLRAPSLPGATSWTLAATVPGTGKGFAGLVYGGGVIRMQGSDVAVDLEGIQLPAGGKVQVLRNHDLDQAVGDAVVRLAAGALMVARGRFTTITRAGREVAALYAEGMPLCLDVGLAGRFEATDRRRPVRVNNRELAVDGVLRRARLLEVSFVPSGADPDARLDPAH